MNEHETKGATTKSIAKKDQTLTPQGPYLQHTVVSDLLVYEKIIGIKTGIWPAVNDGV